MESQNLATLKNLLENLISHIKQNNLLQSQILMSNVIAHSLINEQDKQTLLHLLQTRDKNYIRLNDNAQVFDRISQYLTILQPTKLNQDSLIRIGGAGDGGYVMLKTKQINGGGGNETFFTKITKAHSHLFGCFRKFTLGFRNGRIGLFCQRI
uniref:Uncharacterized protein n=1 Tax=uncultured Helicobacter sp. TaxID=175537 RepID=A0A650ELW8_9HELI|nr:hypothetical protein Helico4rc_0830 [uncultured Helicobacter sp.]